MAISVRVPGMPGMPGMSRLSSVPPNVCGPNWRALRSPLFPLRTPIPGKAQLVQTLAERGAVDAQLPGSGCALAVMMVHGRAEQGGLHQLEEAIIEVGGIRRLLQ